jgi:hypothetical protein
MKTLANLFGPIVILFGVACAGRSPLPPHAPTRTAAASSDPGNSRTESTTVAVPAPRTIGDPSIRALVAGVLQCKFDEVYMRFDWECETHKAWKNSDLLEQDAGQEALLAMLSDTNVRVRALATTKNLSSEWLEKDRTRPRYLLERVAMETEARVAETMAEWVSGVDIERFELQTPYRAMSQSPNPKVRAASARLYSLHKSAFAREVVATLLEDADIEVQSAAAKSLAYTTDVRACELAKKKVAQVPAFKVLQALSSGMCDGVAALVMRQLFTRTKAPNADALENDVSIGFAASTICKFNNDPAVRREGIAVGQRLTAVTWNDGLSTFLGVDVLVACGGQSAKGHLQTLARSKKENIASPARRALEELKGASAP